MANAGALNLSKSVYVLYTIQEVGRSHPVKGEAEPESQ